MMMHRLHLALSLAAISLFAQTPPAGTPQSDSQSSDPTIFRSEVSMLRMDAQVVDRYNRVIPGLRKEDFVLRQDGKQQQIRNFSAEKLPVDVILLLDVSGSMDTHVARIASAAHRALGVLGSQDRVAILVFDNYTRLRMPFRTSHRDAESALERVLDQETFDGGTDITRALLDAASYMSRNARRGARRAIVILTDDQTQRQRDDAAVSRALGRADCVLSALIAPDALHSSGSGGFGPSGLRRHPARTQSAGTSSIALASGGDSMAVEDASAFEDTLARIRERYALYFYLPDGVKPGEERAIQVDLSDAARRRYPGALLHYRRSYLAPNGSQAKDDPEEIL